MGQHPHIPRVLRGSKKRAPGIEANGGGHVRRHLLYLQIATARGEALPSVALPYPRVNQKVDPFPGSDSAQTFPPCRSTIRRTLANPSPVPWKVF